jgi:hypothetical protein
LIALFSRVGFRAALGSVDAADAVEDPGASC